MAFVQYNISYAILRAWQLVVTLMVIGHVCAGARDFPEGHITTPQLKPWRLHTLFSVECNNYFDWQTVGLMHSYKKSGQPGPITRLLSCTKEQLQDYKGMDLAPTHVVPSMSRHPVTGDWYPAINKPAGVVHWLNHSAEAQNVDWVVILDADMIIRSPIIPWELGVEKGRPVSASYGYLIGCDNELAKLHTKHPEYCDKVGGLLAMQFDDLRALAPFWLSKTEEVREDRAHWATNITGDIYGQGWISEMYGYSFGAAEVGLRHKSSDDLMIYPGYIPTPGFEPILLHYGLPFHVGNWSFDKANYHTDNIVYDCNRLFAAPPFPKEVQMMEQDENNHRALLLSIECINTVNEGLILHHEKHGCLEPPRSEYLEFLKTMLNSSVGYSEFLTQSRTNDLATEKLEGLVLDKDAAADNLLKDKEEQQSAIQKSWPKIHTLFSVECSSYFDWQTVGLVHSFELSGQPGYITRLLSCTEEDLKNYKGMDLAPTHLVPSMSTHPLTGDRYPAINKPAAVLHWLNHVVTEVDFLIVMDADMILRGPVTPWDFGAERGHPVSVPYNYLIGCDNELARIHTRNPEACDKVGGIIIIHIEDLRALAPLWLHKTEQVRADKAHWATNISGDQYGKGWISEMYGYAFGAAEALLKLLNFNVGYGNSFIAAHSTLNLRHRIRDDIMLYPGYIPFEGVEPPVLHYGLEFGVGNWKFNKAHWTREDMTNICWRMFPEPPDPSSLATSDRGELRRDQISIECITTLNKALYLHHKKRGCLDELDQEVKEDVTESGGKLQNTPLVREVTDGRQAELEQNEIKSLINPSHSGMSAEKIGGKFSDKNSSGFQVNKSMFEPKHSRPIVGISPRYWMVALWTILVVFFLVVISTTYSRHHSTVQKQKLQQLKLRKAHAANLNGESSNSRHMNDYIVSHARP